MKASKFTEAQKAFILKQREEGTPVAEICRKAGIGQSTYFAWKKRYGRTLPDEMRRLKRIVADLTLDRPMFSDFGSVKRKATDPPGVMALFDVTNCLRLSMASGGGRLQSMDRVVQNAPHPIGPREIDQPPPLRDIASRHRGENSGQAMASFFHLNSVLVFHSISISTANLRAVAIAALAKPRRPASRTVQLFNAENFFTRPIKVVATSNSRPRMALSPHFEMRPDQSISPD